ncbi:MAG: hypothetical protein AB1410_09055 [Acidobacteriota bacterium]
MKEQTFRNLPFQRKIYKETKLKNIPKFREKREKIKFQFSRKKKNKK